MVARGTEWKLFSCQEWLTASRQFKKYLQWWKITWIRDNKTITELPPYVLEMKTDVTNVCIKMKAHNQSTHSPLQALFTPFLFCLIRAIYCSLPEKTQMMYINRPKLWDGHIRRSPKWRSFKHEKEAKMHQNLQKKQDSDEIMSDHPTARFSKVLSTFVLRILQF